MKLQKLSGIQKNKSLIKLVHKRGTMTDTLSGDIDEVLKKTGKELVVELERLIERHGEDSVKEWREVAMGESLLHIFARTGL